MSETTASSAHTSSVPKDTVSKNFVYDLCRLIASAALTGKGNILVASPALMTREMARSGAYDRLPDSAYSQLITNADWAVRTLWKDSPALTYDELLQNILAKCSFTKDAKIHIGLALRESLVHAGAVKLNDNPPPAFGFTFLKEEGPAEEDPFDDYIETPEPPVPHSDPAPFTLTPKEINDRLSLSICGQEDARRAVSMLLWNHANGRKRNMLLMGPTGCGKTALFEALEKIYPSIITVDGSRLSRDGWKGSYKLSDIFKSVTPEEAEHAIVVIDEADKLFEPETSSAGENVSFALQSELLKMIEGSAPAECRGKPVDTSHISFVFTGSFQHMIKAKISAAEDALNHGHLPDTALSYGDTFTQQDLISYGGLRQEIAGRIDCIIQMQPMTAADFRSILDTESMSPLTRLEQQYGITITLSDRQKDILCHGAAESHLGVRYLRSALQQQLDAAMFDHPDRKEYLLYPEA